jgi:hypothetical protein
MVNVSHIIIECVFVLFCNMILLIIFPVLCTSNNTSVLVAQQPKATKNKPNVWQTFGEYLTLALAGFMM